jgi:DNA-binding response OmpR family regulator
MPNIRILVAEDDANIRTGLVDTLESEGYQVTPANDGHQAFELFSSQSYDLVILDIMMPGRSGYDVCRDIRTQNQQIPIIMLTAKGEEIDKVVGLQLGADDYITKPFGVHELLARIAAVLRRTMRPKQNEKVAQTIPQVFQIGNVEIDTAQFRARREDEIFDLSAREIALLKYFYQHPNQVLSRDTLLNAVWGIDYFGTTRTLDQHVARLRKKVESNPRNPQFITTVHGIGYRYEGPGAG